MKIFQLVCLGGLYLLYVITMFLFGLSFKKKNSEERSRMQTSLIVMTSFFQVLLLFYIAVNLAVGL
ncbi:MAG: hypothetical protein J6C25_02520 [Treponema sp.]|nr:hypothetical protein [Treponema sp.]